MQDLLNMGGYAGYVWPCFGLAALILGGFAVSSVLRLKSRQRELAALKSQRDRPAS